ncbi:acyl-CoA synthetase (NDP forming) [Mesorhizobium sp. J18]|uniref:acetate--CoA ligase family protein n=1 Tax=Mesorhizobium sp. J18 TaxID=935263 RepID=UPI00119AF8BC|nr:acetate--CoA ligase family protein [Mesorhizobium sp. J18]TWG99729.1 acyl-CoA synthetase (NDP forming) [Mesorhizobium sp. J18]
MRQFERLLRPKSIAVFGGTQARAVVEQSRKMGFAGEIWPVHPAKGEIAGLRAYRSVADLPRSPDAAFVGVNRHATIEIVRELSAHGAGGAVCFASGFREAGDDAEGEALQRQLVEAAGQMPIIGPNCYGLINYADGALLWPDQHGGKRLAAGERGVAIITQSSNIAINMTMQKRGLPIAYLMTAGNQAQTGLSEIALGLIEDERVSVLGLHIEGFDSAAGFERLAARARELRKPVVAMKIGRSEQARAAAISHTASLAGTAAASDVFLKRLGISRVHSIPVFLETLKLLHAVGPLPGFRLSSVSCSGGEAAVMADSAEGRRIRFPTLDESHSLCVKETLGPLVAIANPLDYHTFIWNDEAAMTATFSAFVSGGFDLNLLVLDFPRADRCSDADWWPALRAFKTALKANGAHGAVVASMPENMPEAYASVLLADGMVPLCGIEEALAAAEAAAVIGEMWKRPTSASIRADVAEETPLRLGLSPSHLSPVSWGKGNAGRDDGCSSSPPLIGGGVPSVSEADRGANFLDEAAAKAMLAAAGLPVPKGRRATTVAEAAAAAAEIGFPVALKALGLPHKSEHGAVRLNLRDSEAVKAAAESLLPLGSGLYVERMVAGGAAELIVGVRHDSVFGPVMTVGFGGVLVELLQDSATLLLPASREEIDEALRGLKLFPLLDGYRGRAKADLSSAVEAIGEIGQFARIHASEIAEMDINPLIVCAERQGAWIADALVVRRSEE